MSKNTIVLSQARLPASCLKYKENSFDELTITKLVYLDPCHLKGDDPKKVIMTLQRTLKNVIEPSSLEN